MQNQQHNHNVLDTDKIGRLLIKLSVPMFFGMAVQTIYAVVDTIFIGRYVGTVGIASLSVCFPLQMLAMGVANMVGVGGASLISRLIGSGNKPGAERSLGNGLAAGILLALVLTVIVLPFISFWIKLIGASENVLPFARDYLTIVMSGTVFNVLSSTLIVYVRAEGNARVGMTAVILGSVLNIVLDAVFMIWLGMGIKGAALATIIAQAVTTLYVLTYYFSGSSYLKLHIRNFLPDLKILNQLLAIGVAQFAQTIATSFAALFIIKMAATYGGDLALSTFGVIQRLLQFGMMPGMVLGQAMQPILGFNYGAKRYKYALKSISLATIASTVLSVATFLVFYIFAEQLIGLFTSDKQLIHEGVHVTRLVFLALPVLGMFNVGQQIFPAIGKAMQTFIVAVVRPALFLLPLVIILPRFLDLNGVWLAFPASDFLTFLLVIILVIPLVRKFRKAAAGMPGERAIV